MKKKTTARLAWTSTLIGIMLLATVSELFIVNIVLWVNPAHVLTFCALAGQTLAALFAYWIVSHWQCRPQAPRDELEEFIEEWPFQDAKAASLAARHDRGLFEDPAHSGRLGKRKATSFIEWCREQVGVARKLDICP